MRAPLALVAVLACGSQVPAPTTVTAPAPGGMSLSATSLGPLTAKTPANLLALRKTLVGYEVVPVNVDTTPLTPSLEYQVFENGKLLFVIVPTNKGMILNVHVTSPKVTVAGHKWRVGAPFDKPDVLTTCECWGGKPACFKKGEHVAVGFDRACKGTGDARARRVLEGVPIKKLVWRPEAFGGAEYGGDEYGGKAEDEAVDTP